MNLILFSYSLGFLNSKKFISVGLEVVNPRKYAHAG